MNNELLPVPLFLGLFFWVGTGSSQGFLTDRSCRVKCSPARGGGDGAQIGPDGKRGDGRTAFGIRWACLSTAPGIPSPASRPPHCPYSSLPPNHKYAVVRFSRTRTSSKTWLGLLGHFLSRSFGSFGSLVFFYGALCLGVPAQTDKGEKAADVTPVPVPRREEWEKAPGHTPSKAGSGHVPQ